jgi:hypothetical protein
MHPQRSMGRLIVTEKIATGFSAYGQGNGQPIGKDGVRTMVRIDVGYWALVVGLLRLRDVPAPPGCSFLCHSYVHRWGMFTVR